VIEPENESTLEKAVQCCRERGVVIPTFAQQKDPALIPASIKEKLARVGLWDVDPLNLFRITWKNEPKETGGGFNNGNWIEFPRELTGVEARIVGIVGKWFPTGAHKVGAAFGCLVPRLVSGKFDPSKHKAVWPSTGNYCRGGAYDCALLGCTPVAILPEEMSRERFEWLASIGAEVIATPGCESNVKEIYDKCWEIRRTRPECVIFNQFEEFGNAIWHYHVTGAIIDEIFDRLNAASDVAQPPSAVESDHVAQPPSAVESDHVAQPPSAVDFHAPQQLSCSQPSQGRLGHTLRLAGYVSATGSAGTIAAGDFLRTKHRDLRVAAVEALQCPTLLRCGFGGHRIEGIGDKHIPWIHNVRNTDLVVAVDDARCLALMRLFNEDAGRARLERQGVAGDLVERLSGVGISGICNLVASIKTARYYELGPRDVIFTPLTDSMQLYGSRITEQREQFGEYTAQRAACDFARHIEAITTDSLRELTYVDRKALHNFKYFTWVEQQQRGVEDLRRLWQPEFWEETFGQVEAWDRMIEAFNERVGSKNA